MFDVKTLIEMQEQQTQLWHFQDYKAPGSEDFLAVMTQQNRCNFELWHQEDDARDRHATDSDIARVKRAIDKLNQLRNDLIEVLDEHIIHWLQESGVQPSEQAVMNSETPGSIIDRLSINALKIYHMREQTERQDAEAEHRAKCQSKLELLQVQRQDLALCLEQLIEALHNGDKVLKVYRQMKMYNDETLNPVLYRKTS